MERPPCTACRVYKKQCTDGCVFAPFIQPYDETKIINIEEVYEQQNVERMIRETEPSERRFKFEGLAFQAEMRIRDPVNGICGAIEELSGMLVSLRRQMDSVREEISHFKPTDAAFEGGSQDGAGTQQESSVNLSERVADNAVSLDGTVGADEDPTEEYSGEAEDFRYILSRFLTGFPQCGQTSESTGSEERSDDHERYNDNELPDGHEGSYDNDGSDDHVGSDGDKAV